MKITLPGFSKNLGGGVCFSCVQPKGPYKHFKKRISAIFAGLAVSSAFYTAMPQLHAAPRELINIEDVDESLHIDLAYTGKHNFLGRKVKNYQANTCYLKPQTALAVSKANLRLASKHLKISLRDCWRPASASFDMSQWADEQDTKRLKQEDLNFTQQIIFEDARLFDSLGFLRTSRLKQLNYLALYSNHNKGSTVDLEILKWIEGRWVKADTGTAYDVFSPRSAMNAKVGAVARKNRDLLATAMRSEGFRGLSSEWWHWTHSASNSGPYLDGKVD